MRIVVDAHPVGALCNVRVQTVALFSSLHIRTLSRHLAWPAPLGVWIATLTHKLAALVHRSRNNAASLQPLFEGSRFARTRSRFAVPVILVNGKNICRSATLARGTEVVVRESHARAANYFYGNSGQGRGCDLEGSVAASVADGADGGDDTTTARRRQADAELLRRLGVRCIADLMVEERKVKYGLTVTSSEKVERKGKSTRQVATAAAAWPNHGA